MARRCAADLSYAEVPRLDVSIHCERGRRAGEDDRALVHDQDALPDPRGEPEVLLDEEERESGRAHLREYFADLLHELRCKTLRRLVEEKHRRIPHERGGDGEHLLLAVRELVAARRATAGEDREEIQNAGLVPAIHQRPRGDREILAHAEIAEDAAPLGDERDACARDTVRRGPGEYGAVDTDRSAARSQKTRDRGDRRGLAGAVAPDKGD